MKRKKFFIIMIGLVLTIVLLVAGCSSQGDEDNPDEDKEIIIENGEVEDEENEDEENEDEENEDPTEVEAEENSYDIEIGKLAPNFTLENLYGEEVSLEDYRGKIVMLNFWGTWCPYCVKEMPDMNQLQGENDDLVILAVNVQEDKDKVKRFIEDGGYEFEVVMDPKGDVAQTYLVGPLPTSYFIDKEGILTGGIAGMLEYPRMNQIVEGIRKNQ